MARAREVLPAKTPLTPSVCETDEVLDKAAEVKASGADKRLEIQGVVLPQISNALGTRRWLAEYVPAPWNKQQTKRTRLTYLDAVLAIARAQRDLLSLALVSFGEGSLAVAGYLSSEIRLAAYAERHVNPDEQKALEDAASCLTHAILVTPHSFPIKTYMPFLRHYVPELACVLLPSTIAVTVVLAERDTTTEVGRAFARTLQGAVTLSPVWSVRSASLENGAWRACC